MFDLETNEEEKKNGMKRRKQEGRERKVSYAAAIIFFPFFFLQFNIKEYNEKRVKQKRERIISRIFDELQSSIGIS
jgi:hypothetical protein